MSEPGRPSRSGVQGIPSLVVLRNGREVARRAGAAPAAELNSHLTLSANGHPG